ncbi:MAG: multiheme c-type cytochrome [Bacteroidota bacterium]
MSKRTSLVADAAGLIAAAAAAMAVLAGTAGCGDAPKLLTRAELMDPAACKDCHPQQFSDWSGSMHAYAAEDPLFLAMNQRGQRETNGALGDFCVKCHAPVALAEGLTTDGLNLPALAPHVKGVTCYFCHSAVAVEGTHNNPLRLAKDGSLFGPFAQPVAGTPHKSSYSPLFDPVRPESADACGSCHDIVNQHGAAVERTFTEWKETLFSDLKVGQTCVRCHMNQSQGPASTKSNGRIRSLGSHGLPGIDLALTDFPQADAQRQEVQDLLNSTLSGTLCLTDDLRIDVTLDNLGAGHSFPSGATPDRRLWVEVVAYAGGGIIYQTGAVPPGQSVEAAAAADPDLWLIRDCLFDEEQRPVHMFWEAASLSPSNQIPGAVKLDLTMPDTLTRSHVKNVFPRTGPLPTRPDRMTLRVIVKAVGDDVLQDLVASGDLDPAIAARVPQLTIGGGLAAAMEWTPAEVQRRRESGQPPLKDAQGRPVVGLSCVSSPGNTYYALPSAVSRARCE